MQTYAPQGLIAVNNPGGVIRPGPGTYTIESGYSTNIFQGAPVVVDTDGYIEAVAAGDDNLWIGAFDGVEYTDITGRRVYLNFWPASSVGSEIVAYVTGADSPYMVFQIQSDDTLTIDAIGGQANFTTIAGNTTTGLASVGLDASTLVESADQKQMRVVGLNPGPDNEWGDAFPVVLVQNAAHPYVSRLNAV